MDKYSDEDFKNACFLVWGEARGEDIMGQKLVVWVFINRFNAERGDDKEYTLTKAILKSGASSCVKKGKLKEDTPSFEDIPQSIKDNVAQAFKEENQAQNCLYFNSNFNGNTYHDNKFNYVFTHGGHKFYK